jgi:hypothetical protein
VPVHHGQAFGKNIDALQVAGIENIGATRGFREGVAQQHVDMRDELKRMSDKVISQLERRICNYRIDTCGRFVLEQEVDSGLRIRAAVIDQVSSMYEVPSHAEHPHDAAGTAGWLPDPDWQVLDAQQGIHGLGRRLVAIVAALIEGVREDGHGRTSVPVDRISRRMSRSTHRSWRQLPEVPEAMIHRPFVSRTR